MRAAAEGRGGRIVPAEASTATVETGEEEAEEAVETGTGIVTGIGLTAVATAAAAVAQAVAARTQNAHAFLDLRMDNASSPPTCPAWRAPLRIGRTRRR